MIKNRIHYYINADIRILNELPEEEQLDQVLCEKSLSFYTKQAWHIIESKKPCIWNWHLDYICEHLD